MIDPRIVEAVESVIAEPPDKLTPAQKEKTVREVKVREAAAAKHDAEWNRRMDPVRGSAPALVEIDPNHPCDRCTHPSKMHAGPDRGSRCMFYLGRMWRGSKLPPRNGGCYCDGYFPA